jgi:hypothetical protein
LEPLDQRASFTDGDFDSLKPGGGVRTSLATFGCRVNPAFVTSSPPLTFAAVPLVVPAHVAFGSFQTIAVLHEGHFFAPSGTVAPH